MSLVLVSKNENKTSTAKSPMFFEIFLNGVRDLMVSETKITTVNVFNRLHSETEGNHE